MNICKSIPRIITGHLVENEMPRIPLEIPTRSHYKKNFEALGARKTLISSRFGSRQAPRFSFAGKALQFNF